jgi:hypothetical protein
VNNREKILTLRPCEGGFTLAETYPTLRAWWGGCVNSDDLTWLLGKGHIYGTLSRKILVRVAVACAEAVGGALSPFARERLALFRSWTKGERFVTEGALLTAHDDLQKYRSHTYAPFADYLRANHAAAAALYATSTYLGDNATASGYMTDASNEAAKA